MIRSKLGLFPQQHTGLLCCCWILVERHILGHKHKLFVCRTWQHTLSISSGSSNLLCGCVLEADKTRAAKIFYSLIKTPGSVLVLREVLSEGWTLPKHSAVIKDASHLLHKTVTAPWCSKVYFLLCWYQDIRIWELRQTMTLYSISVQKRLLKQIYNLSVTKIRFNKRKPSYVTVRVI